MSDSERSVECLRLGKTLPGLAKAPFPGELGEKIFQNISKQAWDEWQAMQIKVINEYRLNMGNPDDYQALIDQMLTFLNLKEGNVLEVENENRGRNK